MYWSRAAIGPSNASSAARACWRAAGACCRFDSSTSARRPTCCGGFAAARALYYRHMKLHQLKVDYDPEQDRLLMLVATSEGMELRLSLTRRFIKLLWPLLVKLAEEASPRIRSQANPEARKALLGLEHEHAVSKADFSKPYDAGTSERPLGD